MKTGISNIVSKSELSNDIKNIINSEVERLDKCLATTTYDTSEISNCPRCMIYKSIKMKNNCFAVDKYHNKFVIEKWANLMGYYVIETNMVLFDCNYNMVGNGDIMLEVDNSKILLKIQSVNKKDFNRILTKGAFKKHVLELMANEWLAEVDSGLLIYENRDDFKFEIFQVHLFVHIIESIKKKCKDLMNYNIKGDLPDRPYKDNGKECQNCNYNKECWS